MYSVNHSITHLVIWCYKNWSLHIACWNNTHNPYHNRQLFICTQIYQHTVRFTRNLAVSSVKLSWLRKPYGAAQSSHGDSSLHNDESTTTKYHYSHFFVFCNIQMQKTLSPSHRHKVCHWVMLKIYNKSASFSVNAETNQIYYSKYNLIISNSQRTRL